VFSSFDNLVYLRLLHWESSESVLGVILLLAVWFFYPLIVVMVQSNAAHFDRKTILGYSQPVWSEGLCGLQPASKGEEVLVSRPDIPRLLAQLLRAIGAVARLAQIPDLSQPAQMQFPSLRAHKSRVLATCVGESRLLCRATSRRPSSSVLPTLRLF